MAETTFHSITLPGANPARVPLTAVEFSTSTVYKVRDYCTYQGKLYICSTAHAAGAWNAAHFTEVNVGDEINTRLVVPPTTEPASTNRRVGDLWIDVNTESPVISIDPQPVAGSTNVPQSGGTFNLIKNLDNNKASKSLLTGDFSATSPYSVNDLCIHDGYLYRCIVDIPTGTAWNASKWQATTIETELARIESEEVNLDVIAETFGNSSSYAVGDYVLHTKNGVVGLYRCTNAVSETSLWNDNYWSEVKLADEVSDLKSAFEKDIRDLTEKNSFDVMAQTNKRSVSGRNVSFNLNSDGSFYVYSTGSEQTYFLTLYNDKNNLPFGMKAGGTYHLDYSATVVHFYFYVYKSDAPDTIVTLLNRYTSTDFTIPQDALGAMIRLTVLGTGTVVDETVNPQIITTPSNQELNAKIANVRDEINTQIENYYIKIDGAYHGLFMAGLINIPAVGDTVDINRSPSTSGIVSAIIPCAQGDYLNLNISGAGSTTGGARAWAFCDENMIVLSRANQGVTLDHEVLVVPDSACYVVVNTRQILGYYAVVGLIQQESAWTGKTWYSYGTSMSDINPDGISGNNGTSGKWPLIVDKLSGMIRHNGAIGSGGICPSLSHGGNVKSAILSTPWDVDLVTMEAGLNDWGKIPLGDFGDMSDDTFIGNFTQCIKYLVEHTRAKVVLVTMPCRTYTSSEQTARYDPFLISAYGYSYRDLLDLEIAVCQIYGVEVIDTAANVPMDFRNKATVRDFVHFTDLGGTIYGNYIWSKLKNMQPCPVVFSETDYV